MDARRLESAAVAALAVLVVGVAAATLGETTGTEGVGAGGGGSSGGAGPAGGGSAPLVPQSGEPLPLVTLVLVVTAVLLIAGFVLFPRYTVRQVAWAGVVTAFLLGVLWLLFQAFSPGMPGNPAQQDQNYSEPALTGTGTGQGMGGGGASLPEPILLGLVVAGLLGLGVVGLVLRDVSAPDRADGEAAGEAAAALSAIGRSAGRAADRLAEDDAATLDNEVYRAWREMTDHLDVEDPDVRTPGEFREAALEAGMAAEDVDRLTDLFEVVRYGDAPVTETREAEAAAAMRRIEERYAEDEAEEGSA